jgi:hypothetical protein
MFDGRIADEPLRGGMLYRMYVKSMQGARR